MNGWPGEDWLARWIEQRYPQLAVPWKATQIRLAGTGSPLNVVSAPVGSTYQRLDGGAGTSFYVKESGGSGSTGWVAK